MFDWLISSDTFLYEKFYTVTYLLLVIFGLFRYVVKMLEYSTNNSMRC